MAWSDGITPGTQTYGIAASTNPRVRVVAGPGTGKSFAMKRRVARLLDEGVYPRSILPVTFTRIAAEDLHRELVGMAVPGCDRLRGVTLHGLALRMLTRNHVLAATGRVARPLNEFELQPLTCDLMRNHGGKREVEKRKQAYEAAWARLQHETPGFAATARDASFAADLLSWMRFHGAMLIGEVIPQLYEYLRSNPAAAERSEFAHILVDEYQDLNRAEQGVIDLLSDTAHVCIVGDDDQSIYSFKHAHPEGIRDWIVSNASADDLDLNECRRCPTRVVEMTNSLIQTNQLRYAPRALVARPENGQGDVRIIQYQNLADEVRGVSQIIADMVAAGTPPGDILVLAQRGAIGTPIYEALIERTVPVKSYYSEAELGSREAQLSFTLLKLFVDKDDRVALRWYVGVDGSNWNASGYRRIREYCERTGESPWSVLAQLSAGTLALAHTQRIVERFQQLSVALENLELLPDLRSVVDVLFPADVEALRDVRTLAESALDEMEDEDRGTLLSKIALAIAQPEIPSEVEDVRIMSLHKSKGLSSPVTIISGCVEGLLPRQPEPGTPPAEAAAIIEEQRRLFFVGISPIQSPPGRRKAGNFDHYVFSRNAYGKSHGLGDQSGEQPVWRSAFECQPVYP